MSCSWPKTSTLFALRAAGVRGTLAHDCANGAAAIVAPLLVAALRLTAVADDAMIITASAAPAIVAMRLSIFSLRFLPAPDGRGRLNRRAEGRSAHALPIAVSPNAV